MVTVLLVLAALAYGYTHWKLHVTVAEIQEYLSQLRGGTK